MGLKEDLIGKGWRSTEELAKSYDCAIETAGSSDTGKVALAISKFEGYVINTLRELLIFHPKGQPVQDSDLDVFIDDIVEQMLVSYKSGEILVSPECVRILERDGYLVAKESSLWVDKHGTQKICGLER